MLSGDPSTSSGARPSISIAAASSPGSSPSSRAFVSAASRRPCRNICGVCARQRRSRGNVRRLRPPSSACFTVSATGTASSPPTGSRRHAAISASTSGRRTQGRAASCTSTQSSACAVMSACSPFRTDAARVVPPATATTRRRTALGNRSNRRSPSASTATPPAMPFTEPSVRRPCSSSVRPAMRR